MRPHAHANMCAAFMYSHNVGVSVYLSSFDTPLLLLLGYKPFSVPGAPLAMSDWFGLSFLCLTVSVVGQLCCTVSSCYRLLITPKKKQTGRLEIKYLNLWCSVHPSPQFNKRLSHPLYIKVYQHFLLLLHSEC